MLRKLSAVVVVLAMGVSCNIDTSEQANLYLGPIIPSHDVPRVGPFPTGIEVSYGVGASRNNYDDDCLDLDIYSSGTCISSSSLEVEVESVSIDNPQVAEIIEQDGRTIRLRMLSEGDAVLQVSAQVTTASGKVVDRRASRQLQVREPHSVDMELRCYHRAGSYFAWPAEDQEALVLRDETSELELRYTIYDSTGQHLTGPGYYPFEPRPYPWFTIDPETKGAQRIPLSLTDELQEGRVELSNSVDDTSVGLEFVSSEQVDGYRPIFVNGVARRSVPREVESLEEFHYYGDPNDDGHGGYLWLMLVPVSGDQMICGDPETTPSIREFDVEELTPQVCTFASYDGVHELIMFKKVGVGTCSFNVEAPSGERYEMTVTVQEQN